MQGGAVHNLISLLDRSFQDMGVACEQTSLETLSLTIYRAMTAQARHFHNLDHALSFYDPRNPTVGLAALYHDIVYYQVDMGFSPPVQAIISAYIIQQGECFFIRADVPQDDALFFLTLDIFGLKPGQILTSSNVLNEFLSALVMDKQLAGLLSKKILAMMNVYIEATIPFRGFDRDGRNHFALMEMRLPEVFHRNGVEISPAELVQVLQAAVAFANKDLESFGESNPARFLDNTWKLLPETNPDLRLPEIYTIGAYRLALQKMLVFFQQLDPDTVFLQYRGVPGLDQFNCLVQRAHNNIEIARQYLQIKILGMTILEAMALSSGGDAPLSLFMGDIPRDGFQTRRLENFLPDLPTPAWMDGNSAMYRLLESGRTNEISFDTRNSPLELFICKSVPPQKIASYAGYVEDFYSGEISAEEFLSKIDPIILQPLARASSRMAVTRRDALLRYAGKH